MMKKILLVDDDTMIVDSLTYSLKKEGFSIISCGDGLEAVTLATKQSPDLIVLDVMLPSIDGWEVCRRIRRNSSTPIIMLTARGDEFDRVVGLEMGADDYLPKPFSFRELLARIRAILRRIEFDRKPSLNHKLTIGDIMVDNSAHQVFKNGTPLIMTQKEYDLLFTLMNRAGKVVSRADLLDIVWGVDWLGDTRTLDVHIRWVREKVEDIPGKPRYITTVRGVGYRFASPQEVDA